LNQAPLVTRNREPFLEKRDFKSLNPFAARAVYLSPFV
jgi:hypothetical protein